MPQQLDVRLGMAFGWDLNENGWKDGFDQSMQKLSRLSNFAHILDRDLATPPGSPANGDTYIVASSPTGDWAGQAGNLATWNTFLSPDAWVFYAPYSGLSVYIEDEGLFRAYDDSLNLIPIEDSLVVETVTANKTITVADSRKYLRCTNAGPITITVPQESTENLALGFNFVVSRRGAGSVTIVTEGSDALSPNSGVVDADKEALVTKSISGAPSTWDVRASGGGGAASNNGAFSTISSASGVLTISLAANAFFETTLTENITSVVINDLVNGNANFFTLKVAQDATGGRTWTNPGSFDFPSGQGAYVPSAAANAVDILEAITYDDGVTWQVSYAKDYG